MAGCEAILAFALPYRRITAQDRDAEPLSGFPKGDHPDMARSVHGVDGQERLSAQGRQIFRKTTHHACAPRRIIGGELFHLHIPRERQERHGTWQKLYHAIEAVFEAPNILNACIGYPETESEYLARNSERFHAYLGYSLVGEFHKCGYKCGRWYNMAWVEKGAHSCFPRACRHLV